MDNWVRVWLAFYWTRPVNARNKWCHCLLIANGNTTRSTQISKCHSKAILRFENRKTTSSQILAGVQIIMHLQWQDSLWPGHARLPITEHRGDWLEWAIGFKKCTTFAHYRITGAKFTDRFMCMLSANVEGNWKCIEAVCPSGNPLDCSRTCLESPVL